MTRMLRSALAIFVVTVALAVFVGSWAYKQATQQLASEFAQVQWAVSVYTAAHLRDQYHVAALGLLDVARKADPDGAGVGDPAQLNFMASLFAGSEVTFFALDREGRVARTWPAGMAPPPAGAVAECWERVKAGLPPRPAFGRDKADRSFMVLARALPPPEGRDLAGAVGLSVELATLLIPQGVPDDPNTGLLVVDTSDLTVVGATLPLEAGVRFDELYQTATGTLLQTVRECGAGYEQHALSTIQSESGKTEPHLVGVQGLTLGGRKLVIAATSARQGTVDTYLGWIVRWIGSIAAVMLLGLASFVALVGQTRAAIRQEQRQREERNWLYQISLALLSVSKLDDVLGRIAEQARELFRAEGATIALVDPEGDGIHFRYVASRDPAVKEAVQGLRVPKDQGVIGWVVSRGEAVHVTDASKDPRFAAYIDHQTGAHTNSLLCAPLLNQASECFGAIELVNSLDQPFPESDLMLLQSLAVMASAAVERAMWQEREEQQQRLQREMEIARMVQQGLLPRNFPQVVGFELYGANDPAREVGGDFYDFIPISDRHIGIVIADVADKGLGAAMFMVMCRSLLYSCASRELSPSKVLTDLNTQIVEVSTADLFVTAFYGVLDVPTRTFTYTNAGHNPRWCTTRRGAVNGSPCRESPSAWSTRSSSTRPVSFSTRAAG